MYYFLRSTNSFSFAKKLSFLSWIEFKKASWSFCGGNNMKICLRWWMRYEQQATVNLWHSNECNWTLDMKQPFYRLIVLCFELLYFTVLYYSWKWNDKCVLKMLGLFDWRCCSTINDNLLQALQSTVVKHNCIKFKLYSIICLLIL